MSWTLNQGAKANHRAGKLERSSLHMEPISTYYIKGHEEASPEPLRLIITITGVQSFRFLEDSEGRSPRPRSFFSAGRQVLVGFVKLMRAANVTVPS